MSQIENSSPRKKRAQRSDGEKTRAQLLEAAMKIFAARGYSDTTSKDICQLAGTNTAAVNYYFSSKDKLYEEVLVEAHQQLIDMENIKKISDSPNTPEEKLTSLIKALLHTCSNPATQWGIRIFLRELVNPTGLITGMINKAVIPKSTMIKQLISDIIGYPTDSPETQRATAFVILPCISLVIFPEKLRLSILHSTERMKQSTSDEMLRYIMAGLNALKKPLK